MNNKKFNPMAFVLMSAVVAFVSFLTSWFSGLNFFLLFTIGIVAVLINGFMASNSDTD